MWYVTVEPCRVSVLRIRVCDLGGTEWSRRCCTNPAFGRVSIFLTSYGYLTLAMTSHGLPRDVGVLGCSICLWAINGVLSTVGSTHDYNFVLVPSPF